MDVLINVVQNEDGKSFDLEVWNGPISASRYRKKFTCLRSASRVKDRFVENGYDVVVRIFKLAEGKHE